MNTSSNEICYSNGSLMDEKDVYNQTLNESNSSSLGSLVSVFQVETHDISIREIIYLLRQQPGKH